MKVKYNRDKGFFYMAMVHIIVIWETLIFSLIGIGAENLLEFNLAFYLSVTVILSSLAVQVMALKPKETEGDE